MVTQRTEQMHVGCKIYVGSKTHSVICDGGQSVSPCWAMYSRWCLKATRRPATMLLLQCMTRSNACSTSITSYCAVLNQSCSHYVINQSGRSMPSCHPPPITTLFSPTPSWLPVSYTNRLTSPELFSIASSNAPSLLQYPQHIRRRHRLHNWTSPILTQKVSADVHSSVATPSLNTPTPCSHSWIVVSFIAYKV